MNDTTTHIETDPDYPDTEGLGYDTFRDGSVIGYVESVNGRDAQVCEQFEPTHHELLQLAKHWYRELTESDLLWFHYETTGSTEWRTVKYAQRRLHRIRRVIGDTPVGNAIAEVDAEFLKRLGETQWQRFQVQR